MTLTELAVRGNHGAANAVVDLQRRMAQVREGGASRVDQAVWLILIPIAVVIALGLLTAWFIYCQSRGGWPAMDMPSFSAGGTWKVYCAK